MKKWTFEGEDHTLGCLLRGQLFSSGAEFASCRVPHPSQRTLIVECDNEEILRDALHLMRKKVVQMKNCVDLHRGDGPSCIGTTSN